MPFIGSQRAPSRTLFLRNSSFPCYLTTRIRQFFVVKLDNVERIENQDNFREVFPDRFQKGARISVDLPSATSTTAPLSKFITIAG
uniref:Uncharacterized protein n=1 Tax=Candidatus Kentrum sp. TC TaxID=2126339 RepID=A0A450Y8J2_9GAMM|nr:MAG: hypothetical protein BECKTC1821D_GA0114238_10017 [Candidatus Kentron sp. TC]VFK37825.1 MAG: hypothetical protein BECKTC1821E_GA0114239_1001111 [Candidatus Kentron sp. TC]